ncbi:MAG: transposase [Myxococcales bacterium]
MCRVAEDRASKADHPERTTVVPGEIEAVIQPLKYGPSVPAYKPSIIVHESGLIVGQVVDPSSEIAALPALRQQHRQILGADPTTMLFDAGYHCREVLEALADQDILCPAGTVNQDFIKRGRGGMLGKASFAYNEHADTYRCPGGQTLSRVTNKLNGPNGPYTNYRAAAECCAKCPLKASCTKAQARTVTRWEADELKEAMAQVMAQPAARATFRRRKAIVEPVFAVLKERQRLRRFRRRGLRNVRMEFALHCIAFNLGRALSIERRRLVVLLFWGRLERAHWRLMAVAAWLP